MAIISRLKATLSLDDKQFKKGLKGAEKQTANFGKVIGRIGGAIAAAFSVKQIAEWGFELSKINVTAKNVNSTFETLGISFQDLKDATGAAIADVKLKQMAIQARNLGVNVNQLATYFEFATIRAAETGESIDYLVNSIVIGVGRQSRLVLDNLGIGLAELNAEIEKTGSFADAANNIIIRSLDESVISVKDAVAGVDKLTSSWENYKEFVASSGIGDFFNQLAKDTADVLDVWSGAGLSGVSLIGKTMEELIVIQASLMEQREASIRAYGEEFYFANQILKVQRQMAKLSTPGKPETPGRVTPGSVSLMTKKTPGVFGAGLQDELPGLTVALDKYINTLTEVGIKTNDLNIASVELGDNMPVPSAEDIKEWELFTGVILDLSQAIQHSLAMAITVMADSIGQLIGGDTMGALDTFISGIAGLMKQFGALLIAWGVAQLAIKASAGNPYVAIAAGAALVAIGGLMASTGSKVTGSSYYGGSGSYGGGTYNGGGSYDNNREVVMIARGDDLVGVINRNIYKNGING